MWGGGGGGWGGGIRVGGGVHDSYIFPVQTGGIFYFPWHRHQIADRRDRHF